MYIQITIITNIIIYTHKINVICIYIIYYAYNKWIAISCDAQFRVVNHFCIEKYNKIQYFVALCDKSIITPIITIIILLFKMFLLKL